MGIGVGKDEKQQQIPFGNDNQDGNGKCKSKDKAGVRATEFLSIGGRLRLPFELYFVLVIIEQGYFPGSGLSFEDRSWRAARLNAVIECESLYFLSANDFCLPKGIETTQLKIDLRVDVPLARSGKWHGRRGLCA